MTANYGGNWTALFCTGALQRHPSLVQTEHIYLFANSTGFDGQFYHYIAHDPFLTSDLKNYVDNARYRYRRILVPLLAYGLAMGHSAWIDRACEFVCLLSIGLGTYWSCRYMQNAGFAAAWGLLFLLIPAVPITMDRLVVDAALAALTAAFLYYSRSPSSRPETWKLFAVLACAALVRDMGFLLIMAYCASLASRRQFRMAGTFLLSAAPAIAWYGYVQAKTQAAPYGFTMLPFSLLLEALEHPWHYPAGTPFVGAVVAADYIALAGMLLAFGFAFLWFGRTPADPICIIAALSATTVVFFQWHNVFDYGRIYSPLLLCLSALGAEQRNPWLLLPVAMMLPRIAIQLAPQMLGILHWIAR